MHSMGMRLASTLDKTCAFVDEQIAWMTAFLLEAVQKQSFGLLNLVFRRFVAALRQCLSCLEKLPWLCRQENRSYSCGFDDTEELATLAQSVATSCDSARLSIQLMCRGHACMCDALPLRPLLR